ncbi:MAG: Gfo/Idh/MocA family oxidoreductase, partial [Gammaproteobacteria bacterium]|nr:Gfo/Idh/MocA family oxidoreductase [Gammaproteobacteria bacterium]
DKQAQEGRAFAESCGVEFFEEPQDLLGRIDAVTIATSTPAHFEIAKLFLDNGVHTFVEKPLTTTSAAGRELTALAERKGLKLQVGHVERFNSALLSARDKLGTVRFIECHRLAPFQIRGADVNVVLDLMIHDLDVILSLIDGAPETVSAVGIPVLTDTIDIANARIEFDTGAVANVTASRVSMAAQRKFRVFQRNQYLSIDFGKGDVQLVAHTPGSADEPGKLDEQTWSLEKGDALLAEVAAFVNAVRTDEPCLVGGADGVAALELAERILEDIERREF